MKINKIIIAKINRGEMVTAEILIKKLTGQNEDLKAYWQQKYNDLSRFVMEAK